LCLERNNPNIPTMIKHIPIIASNRKLQGIFHDAEDFTKNNDAIIGVNMKIPIAISI